jgi:hypothetical protein
MQCFFFGTDMLLVHLLDPLFRPSGAAKGTETGRILLMVFLGCEILAKSKDHQWKAKDRGIIRHNSCSFQPDTSLLGKDI